MQQYILTPTVTDDCELLDDLVEVTPWQQCSHSNSMGTKVDSMTASWMAEKNKAGYACNPVAGGWPGLTDGQTDGLTD